jgi:hypothetical protein
MDQSYILKPTNFEFVIKDHFPELPDNRKMGVFLSGGMESCLISFIAKEHYGVDKVVFFYSDDIFSANSPDRNTYIHTNIKRAAMLLDITPTYLEFDYNKHINDRKKSIEDKMASLKIEYDVDFVMFGFTKLFFEVEIFKQRGMTVDKILEIAYADPINYKSTIEEFHLKTGRYSNELLEIDIPAEVYPLLRETSGFIKSPFKNMNKWSDSLHPKLSDALNIFVS